MKWLLVLNPSLLYTLISADGRCHQLLVLILDTPTYKTALTSVFIGEDLTILPPDAFPDPSVQSLMLDFPRFLTWLLVLL